ncbi:hypothetical protein TNCV_2835261 [Trichonephila clavipes]|uniref:Uncharacterized protein n=1 Tax=Trichonephila clavipes TaxID=2585209 RepID=A0A8X6V5L7_TRICX|nr:hypothetical protein TNCV_2835261 [Trichonephila clavipes]
MPLMDHAATSRTIAQPILSDTHHLVFTRTIHCHLYQSGISERRSLLSLPLPRTHSCFCRQWHDEWRAWTTEWNDIVFTGVSPFVYNIMMVGFEFDDTMSGNDVSSASLPRCYAPLRTVSFPLCANDIPLERDFDIAMTATAGSDVVQSGRPIFDDFFQHLWPYIGNNTANIVFQMVKRLWLIRIHQ